MNRDEELKPNEDATNNQNTNEEEENIRLADGDAVFFGNTIRFPESAVHPVFDREPTDKTIVDEENQEDNLDDSEPDDRSFLSFFEETTDDNETEAEEEDADDLDESETLSFDEMIQREETEAEKENLDALIRQNDADVLFTLGEKYENDDDISDLGAAVGDEIEINPTSILEAMIFVGNRENSPLPIEKAVTLMRNVTQKDVRESVMELNRRYDASKTPYRIEQTDKGLIMVLHPECELIRERFFNKTREVKLSQKAIDVLSLIAYHQPISFAEIQEIRPQSGALLNLLLKRGLIEQEKRTVEKESVNYYRTTPRLLKLLGVDSLDELPIVDEVDYR